MNDKPLVETRSLKHYFKVRNGFLHAVDDIDLKIYAGKTLGVVGESGCGKSTLGRTILQLIKPTSGDVLYDGKSIIGFKGEELRKMRRNMQIIFQDPYSSIDPRMTVFDIIAENMIVNRIYDTKEEIYERTTELMDTV
ncbi:MAG: ATP-binding cassette domain-containing protein, partial [Firmicutes bacterium]|nr:ATP-binding cassette domain-containing protein [Bacillota bacterium]